MAGVTQKDPDGDVRAAESANDTPDEGIYKSNDDQCTLSATAALPQVSFRDDVARETENG